MDGDLDRAEGQLNRLIEDRAASVLAENERAGLPPAPPKALATENEAKGNRFLTQGVSVDSRGCHAW